jgi:hypothetical protein
MTWYVMYLEHTHTQARYEAQTTKTEIHTQQTFLLI